MYSVLALPLLGSEIVVVDRLSTCKLAPITRPALTKILLLFYPFSYQLSNTSSASGSSFPTGHFS